MTLSELVLARKGYDQKRVWELKMGPRILAHTMARLWGDSNKVPVRPEQFWPLPGDEDEGDDDDALAEAQREFFRQRDLFQGKTES